MAVIAPSIFVNHGGGPMPLLGDEDHEGLINFLRDEVYKHVNLNELKAIIVVTAHWEEDEVTISSGEKHNLYFDYYGFPSETYKYTYDAPGEPELAKRIAAEMKKFGLESKLNSKRGWDHGVFVPMLMINPAADIPIVQISIVAEHNPNVHYQMGKALRKFRKEGVAVIGSGMSYHNMFEFMSSKYVGKVVNAEFDEYLNRACTSEDEKRQSELANWQNEPGAEDAHPFDAAEHLMPLIVAAGAGGKAPGVRIFNWDMNGAFRLSSFIWNGE